MKDFIKWLGVNEKVAKVAVWMLIIMVFLIIVNTALNSLGFPYYAITYDNLKNIDLGGTIDIILNCVVCILNFCSITLLVFSIKETKTIVKYSILYMILNWIFKEMFGYAALQIFIIVFILIFCYLYSNKNLKYVLYGFFALATNALVQGIAYTYKIKLIDYTSLSTTTQTLLSFDYFIIMAIIILVKEIYLKKRSVEQ